MPVFASHAQAGPILGALSSVTSPQGSFGGAFDIVNAINQSGLSAGYTSGLTDFDAFVASTTHNATGSLNSGFTGAQAPPGQFSLDLGALFTIDALAFWDTQNSGSLRSFNLYADDDQIFGNGVGALIGTFNATGGGFGGPQPTLAQIFLFGSVSTRFLHVDVLTMEGGTNLVPGIGELAFRSAEAVPEPSSIALLLAGLLGLGLARRRGVE